MISELFETTVNLLEGIWVFADTKVPVQTLIDYWVAGLPVYEFLLDFPSVRRAQAKRFIAWLAKQDDASLQKMGLTRDPKRGGPPRHH